MLHILHLSEIQLKFVNIYLKKHNKHLFATPEEQNTAKSKHIYYIYQGVTKPCRALQL